MRYVLLYPLLMILIAWRGIWPAYRSPLLRVCLLATLLPGALYPAVTVFIGGSMVASDLPQRAALVGQYCQMYVFCLAGIVVARELVSIVARFFGLPFSWLGRRTSLTTAMICLAWVLSAWGVANALNNVVVKEVAVEIDVLPEEFDGLRIVQVSDIHASCLVRKERIERIVKTVNSLKPEMIALTGDFVDGQVAARFNDLSALKGLKAPLGVWGVLGNHEYYVDVDGWKKALPKLGIKMLYNDHATATRNGKTFVVAGLTDPMAERYGLQLPSIDKALLGAPETKLKILLSHQPKWAQNYAGKVDVMLSGHTHGAQIWPLIPVVSTLNHGFVKGLYDVAGSCEGCNLKLYVNPGIDVWNGFALRIGTVGEVTVLTIKRRTER